MSETTVGGGSAGRAAPFTFRPSRADLVRVGGLFVLVALVIGAYALHDTPGQGARASLSLILGAALGIVFQRGRFCFFCIFRDFLEPKEGKRDSTGLYAVITALAVGGIGYAVVFGAFLPNPFTGRLPAGAHIGPVSWVLVASGLAFGLGMALSGACISGQLYRLGEGYSRAPLALFGSLIGFGLGFYTWQSVYVGTINQAPVGWLPATLGYGGSVAALLIVLAILAIALVRWLPAREARPAGAVTVRGIWEAVIVRRWPPLISGALVGLIGVFAYFRIEPLGVTSQMASTSRTVLENAGLLAGRLNGLDGFAGCAAVVVQTITENGWLIGGIVAGSFAVVLLANRFQLSTLTPLNSFTALLGGVFMGWGSMLALGCTVGTLLSGISAFAMSGWVFGAAVFIGVWIGIRLKLHRS